MWNKMGPGCFLREGRGGRGVVLVGAKADAGRAWEGGGRKGGETVVKDIACTS